MGQGLFGFSGCIGFLECSGSSYLAADRFRNPKRRIVLGGKEYQDFLGGIGGMLFSTAFAMRLFAPYGVKEVNMEEVYAHATDTLAKTPPEKLPQLMADTTATLKEHFKDKDIAFSEIFIRMMSDMYRYHHIALDNLGNEPEERLTKINNQDKPAEAAPKHTPANAPRNPLGHVTPPAASHTDRIAEANEPQLQIL